MARRHRHKHPSDKGKKGHDHDKDNPPDHKHPHPGDHDTDKDHKGTRHSGSAVVAEPGATGVAIDTGVGTLFGQGQAVGYGDPSVFSSDPGDPVRHYHQQPVYIDEVAATATPATTDLGAIYNTNVGNTPATPTSIPGGGGP